MNPPSDALARVIRLFEGLGIDDCARLGAYYRADARFKDPFNEVSGVPAIEAVFRHMFVQLESPRFRITGRVEDPAAREAVLFWEFLFRFRRSPITRSAAGEQRITGSTHLQFDEQGLIGLHRDYWDAAEELYEKLPILGGLMRWLKRRNAVGPVPAGMRNARQ